MPERNLAVRLDDHGNPVVACVHPDGMKSVCGLKSIGELTKSQMKRADP